MAGMVLGSCVHNLNNRILVVRNRVNRNVWGPIGVEMS